MLLVKILSSVVALAKVVTADESVSAADLDTITSLKARQFGTTLGSSCACTILTSLFSSKVLFPNSPQYTAEATYYWDQRESLSPKCIFVPASTNDVARAVVVLDNCQSQFAIRGGGHMPVVGAANTNGGVLIALSGLRTLKLSSDLKTTEAGPGLNWYDIYSFLEPYGKVVIGGRLKTIGVPGLTLGGGIHYFAAKYGFTMDTILSYEVVIANGQVVTASATSNPDLFWALKGGGNNFGIVTKFTFATYDIPRISTGIQIFTGDVIPTYITAIANLAKYQDLVDTGAGGLFTLVSVPSTGATNAQFFGVQAGNVQKPAVFNNFTAIPSVFSTYNTTTLAYWSSTLNTPYQTARWMYGMHVVQADEPTLQEMWNTFKAGTAPMASIAGFSTNLVFQPIPKSATTVAKTNGIGNTWGLDNSKAYVFWLITSSWTNVADDKVVIDWANGLREKIHAANVQKGKGEPLIYMNDASDVQKPFAGFPAANLARLKSIRAKYDPNLVFRKLATGGYKLD